MASAGSGKFKRKTKLSIHTLEKYGHLQLRPYKLRFVLDEGWGPHRLGYRSAHSNQAAIKHAIQVQLSHRRRPNRDM
jgi:hypothetical protein